ncbi:hypothetical protein AAGO55_24340, partial [Klebsiella pneumoniae]
MMSLWDALRMNMMISYQELVRTFLNKSRPAIYFPAGSDSVLHSPLHREPSEFFQIAWNNPFRIGVDDAGIRGQPPGA